MAFDFRPGEELALLAQTAREFAQERLAPPQRQAERERGVAAQAREAYDAVGFSGLELPESLGGAGLGALARVLVNEELGAGDPGAALALDPLGPALYALLELGGEPAVRELALPLLALPGSRAVLATLDDADGSLQLDGGRARVELPYVPADRVDLLLLLQPERVVVLERGFELTPLPGAGLRAAGASALHAQDAPVRAIYEGAAGAQRALAAARLYLASLLLGVLRQGSDYARAYAQQRVAFGKPIAHHQALAFLLVDMHAQVELCRLLLHEAAFRLESALPDAASACASAFVEAAEAAGTIGPACVQVLGGHGFMQDHPVEKHNREARVLASLLGGVDAARQQVGRALCEQSPPLSLCARSQ